MSKKTKQTKQTQKSKLSDSANRGMDMFEHMMNYPIPPPAFSSSAQANNPSPSSQLGGFASFAPHYQSGFTAFNSPSNQSQSQPPNFTINPSQYQFQTQPPNFTQFGLEDENEVEVDPKLKRKQIPWTDFEAVTLAERWVDATENLTRGNSQTSDAFWNEILVAYNSLVDQKRNKNQLTGKWNKIRADVKEFGSIFQKYNDKRTRQSGVDDKAVYDAAKDHFSQNHNNRKFIYEGCFEVLKECPKFWNDFSVVTQKRLFQEVPDSVDLDDDETPPNPNPNPAMEALFEKAPIRRPPGRTASRKSQKSASSSDATSSRYSSEETRTHITEAAILQKETMMEIQKAAKKKAMFKAFKFLQTPIPPNLSAKERRMLEKARAQVVEEYGSDGDDDEDDDE